MAKDHSSRNTVIVLPGFKPVELSLPKRRYHDLTGKRFRKLVVIRYVGRRFHKSGDSDLVWLCQCDCGGQTLVTSCNLKCTRYVGCGCGISKANWTRRGIVKDSAYRVWSGMNSRTKDSVKYIRRGICKGLSEFDHFIKVVGPRPSLEHSIDRENNNGGYWCGCCDECKSLGRTKNIRWATAYVQGNNKNNVHRITYRGETKTISEWAIALSLPRDRLASRFRSGWTPEAMLETPFLKNHHYRNPIHSDNTMQTQCAKEYLAGALIKELGKKYKCDPHAISNLLTKLGVVKRSKSENFRKHFIKLGERRRTQSKQRSLFDNS